MGELAIGAEIGANPERATNRALLPGVGVRGAAMNKAAGPAAAPGPAIEFLNVGAIAPIGTYDSQGQLIGGAEPTPENIATWNKYTERLQNEGSIRYPNGDPGVQILTVNNLPQDDRCQYIKVQYLLDSWYTGFSDHPAADQMTLTAPDIGPQDIHGGSFDWNISTVIENTPIAGSIHYQFTLLDANHQPLLNAQGDPVVGNGWTNFIPKPLVVSHEVTATDRGGATRTISLSSCSTPWMGVLVGASTPTHDDLAPPVPAAVPEQVSQPETVATASAVGKASKPVRADFFFTLNAASLMSSLGGLAQYSSLNALLDPDKKAA